MTLSDCKSHRDVGKYFKAKYKVDDASLWKWLKAVEGYALEHVIQTALIQDLRGEFPDWNSWYVLLETFKEEAKVDNKPVKVDKENLKVDNIESWGKNLKNWTQGRITFYQYITKALEIGQMTMADYSFAKNDRMYKRQYKHAIPHGCGFEFIDNRMNL